MSDWSDFLFAGDSDPIDLSSLWTSGQDLSGGGADITAAAGPIWGMGDRGLGTKETSIADNGTLSPSAIQTLLRSAGQPSNYSTTGKNSESGFSLGGLAKGLGFLNKDGSLNVAALLGAFAPLAGGFYAANRTDKANQQMQQAIQQANQQITRLLGGSSAMYKPYQDAGAMGVARLTSLPPSNLASRYRPLGSGFSLSDIASEKGALR